MNSQLIHLMSNLSSNLLSILQNLSEVAVAGTDKNGLFYFFNKGAEQLLGYQAEEVIGKYSPIIFFHASELLPYSGQTPQEQISRLLTATERKANNQQEFTCITKQGQAFRVRLIVNLHTTEDYQESGFLLQFEFLTFITSPEHTALLTAPEKEVYAGKEAATIKNIDCDPNLSKNLARGTLIGENEASFRLLFYNHPQPMWVYDCETLRFLAVNEAAINHYGYSEEEFMQMTIKDIRPLSVVPFLLNHVNHIAKENTGLADAGIWQHMKKDGTAIYVHIISHIFQFQGRQADLVVAQDITQQKITESQLRKSQAQMQVVFDASFNALLLIEAHTSLVKDCNSRAVAMFEASSKKQFMNMSANELQKKLFSIQPKKNFLEEVTETGSYDVELPCYTFTGKEFFGYLSVCRLHIENENYYLIKVTDITRSKQAEEELKKSQMRFKGIFEESPVGIAIVSEKGILMEANPALCRMLKYTKEELLRLTLQDIIHPDDLATNLSIRRKAFAGEIKTYQLENRYITKNKEVIWGKLAGVIYKDENSSYTIGIVEDITESKKAAIRILETDRRLQEAEKIANIGSWEVNMVIGEISFSEQFFNIYEITAETDKQPFYINQTWSLNYVHPEDLEFVSELIHHAFEAGKDFNFEHRIITKSGKELYVNSIAKFIHDPNGKAVKVFGTIQDITERKNREQELLKAKQLAEEAALAKQHFLSTMSHELRTPMNAVIGLTHLLLQDNPTSGQVENLQMLKFSSENLMVLINDILDFSKIEANKINFENISFNIRDLINLISQPLNFKAIEKGIVLASLIDERIPALLTGDPVRLTQILNNLLSNAIKFTEKGSVKLVITLESINDDSVFLHFIVRDTGIGIPADKLDAIFESFSQATEDTTRKFGGTGLGLTITRRLLELQGSNIAVESTLGKGSKFHFKLRLGITHEEQKSESFARINTYSQDLSDVRLLLVEDNEVNQIIAGKFLNKWKIFPDYAKDGKEALDKVILQEYNIILMDLQMPVMNGYEATKAIRRTKGERFQKIPIIALTADAIMDVRERALSSGMNDFIAKPFNPTELFDKIYQYVEKKSISQTAEEGKSLTHPGSGSGLDYKNVIELAAGDVDFMVELLNSCKDQLESFKKEVPQIIYSQNIKAFSALVHKMQPMLQLFSMIHLSEALADTANLMADKNKDKDDLHVISQEVSHISDQLIKELNMFIGLWKTESK